MIHPITRRESFRDESALLPLDGRTVQRQNERARVCEDVLDLTGPAVAPTRDGRGKRRMVRHLDYLLLCSRLHTYTMIVSQLIRDVCRPSR